MRTITEKLFNRIAAQAEEAEVQGLSKIAKALTQQLEVSSSSLRDADAFYIYSSDELSLDIKNNLWNSIIRLADFYDTSFDACEMQKIVDEISDKLTAEVSTKLNVKHGIGAFESSLPGESNERVSIEVTEE